MVVLAAVATWHRPKSGSHLVNVVILSGVPSISVLFLTLIEGLAALGCIARAEPGHAQMRADTERLDVFCNNLGLGFSFCISYGWVL